MSKQLTILFAPHSSVGYVNPCIGLGEALVSRRHKVVFAVDQTFQGILSPFGFIEEIITSEATRGLKPGESSGKIFLQSGLLSDLTPIESMKLQLNSSRHLFLVDRLRAAEPQLKAIIAKHNPDVYIVSHLVASPTLIHSSKPWINVFICNPLSAINDERTPPCKSGYPSNGDRQEWEEFRELSKHFNKELNNKYNQWMKEEGFPANTGDKGIADSPYLNIYGFPEELDYLDLRPLPEKWIRVDTFMRKGEKQGFEIPDQFRDRDIEKSKLIYLSLGSICSANAALMKRLVSILANSQHKFIVSKGVSGDTYELAANMWGEPSVPQTKVLPLVDAVITHGGNNTITETLSCGKPMIVMPFFGDQYDNAQRVMEKGYGIRLNPHTVSEHELLDSIEKLLNDKELKYKLSVASKRIENSQSIQRAAEMIENLV